MLSNVIIKKVATFDSEVLSNLQKVNIIYGANGSGKTTVSRILQSPEQYPNSELIWDDGPQLDILVYNKKFRDDNFGVGDIPGVFTIGAATKEEISAIKDKKSQLDEKENGLAQKNRSLDKLNQDLKDLQNQFNDDCWTKVKQKYDSEFHAIFVGYMNSKEKFANKVLDEYNNNKRQLINIDVIKERAKELLNGDPTLIESIEIPDISVFGRVENDEIWNRIIVGKSDIAIAPLIEKLNNSDWVHQGKLFLESDTNICPFCQKPTIDDDFKSQLEKYFDEQYRNDIKSLGSFKCDYDNSMYMFLGKVNNIIEQSKQDSIFASKVNVAELERSNDELKTILSANQSIIESKVKEPSRRFQLKSTEKTLKKLTHILELANISIKDYNAIIADSKRAKNELYDDFWRFVINEEKNSILSYLKHSGGIKKGINNIESLKNELSVKIKQLKSEIETDNKKVTSVQPSVDAINRQLIMFGFTNFSIEKIGEREEYQIKRENGELANTTLSEGEISFITFLYYMQLLNGGVTPESAMNDRIAVIDDPVSSLDASVLFVVSSMIKELIKRIKDNNGIVKQLIVLTHNVYFHKEVSYVDKNHDKTKDVSYWIIRKNNNQSHLQMYPTNPINSTYELLWKELNVDRLSFISTQNIMRRIYETYFRFLGKYNDNDVLDKFSNIEEKEICRSLICWINDGSHCVQDDLNVASDCDIVSRYKEVFKKIFEVTGHKEHYNMMMG